jgi:hypothetical protein
MAEIEQSVLANQCLSTRIPTVGDMRQETTAWAKRRNEAEGTVNWRFRTEDARIKLKDLYPQIDG